MTELVTISLDADQLELARREAERLGISLEAYLSRLDHWRAAVVHACRDGQPAEYLGDFRDRAGVRR